jgi:hypothetical protein
LVDGLRGRYNFEMNLEGIFISTTESRGDAKAIGCLVCLVAHVIENFQ